MMRKRLAGAGAALILASVLVVFGRAPSPVSGSPTTPFGLFVPVYMADQATAWAKATAIPGLRYLISPDNSVIAARADTRAGIANAAAAGKTVLGYMTANYAPIAAPGSPPPLTLPEIQAGIGALFTSAPQLGGIFLDVVRSVDDETSCSKSAAFYQSVGSWFRSAYAGKKLVLNAGTALCAAFEGSADFYMVFEGSSSFYTGAFKPYYANAAFDWLRNLPDERVWMLVYDNPTPGFPGPLDEMSDSAAMLWSSPYAGTVQALVNLPPDDYITALSNRAALITTTPTTTTIASQTTTTAAGVTTTTLVPATTTTAAPTPAVPPSNDASVLPGGAGKEPSLAPPAILIPPISFESLLAVVAASSTTTTTSPTTTTVPALTGPTTTLTSTNKAQPTTTLPSVAPASAGASSTTTTTVFGAQLTSSVFLLSKGQPSIWRVLQVSVTGLPAGDDIKTVSFAKNGRQVKSGKSTKLTVTATNRTATYVATVTLTSGAKLTTSAVAVKR